MKKVMRLVFMLIFLCSISHHTLIAKAYSYKQARREIRNKVKKFIRKDLGIARESKVIYMWWKVKPYIKGRLYDVASLTKDKTIQIKKDDLEEIVEESKRRLEKKREKRIKHKKKFISLRKAKRKIKKVLQKTIKEEYHQRKLYKKIMKKVKEHAYIKKSTLKQILKRKIKRYKKKIKRKREKISPTMLTLDQTERKIEKIFRKLYVPQNDRPMLKNKMMKRLKEKIRNKKISKRDAKKIIKQEYKVYKNKFKQRKTISLGYAEIKAKRMLKKAGINKKDRNELLKKIMGKVKAASSNDRIDKKEVKLIAHKIINEFKRTHKVKPKKRYFKTISLGYAQIKVKRMIKKAGVPQKERKGLLLEIMAEIKKKSNKGRVSKEEVKKTTKKKLRRFKGKTVKLSKSKTSDPFGAFGMSLQGLGDALKSIQESMKNKPTKA